LRAMGQGVIYPAGKAGQFTAHHHKAEFRPVETNDGFGLLGRPAPVFGNHFEVDSVRPRGTPANRFDMDLLPLQKCFRRADIANPVNDIKVTLPLVDI